MRCFGGFQSTATGKRFPSLLPSDFLRVFALVGLIFIVIKVRFFGEFSSSQTGVKLGSLYFPGS